MATSGVATVAKSWKDAKPGERWEVIRDGGVVVVILKEWIGDLGLWSAKIEQTGKIVEVWPGHLWKYLHE
jgi:hypothetical protein